MQFNIDKRFIEILNEQGFSITWEQFRSAYDIRRAERDSDPVLIARKKKRDAQYDREFAVYQAMLLDSLKM